MAYREQVPTSAGTGTQDIHSLAAEFARNPRGCWQLLQELDRYPDARRSTHAFIQALAARELEDLTVDRGLPQDAPTVHADAPRGSSPASRDERLDFLKHEHIYNPEQVLARVPDQPLAYFEAWIAEAKARVASGDVKSLTGWVRTCMLRGSWPEGSPGRTNTGTSPKAPGGSSRQSGNHAPARRRPMEARELAAPPSTDARPHPHAAQWQTMQQHIAQQIDPREVEVWFHQTILHEIDEEHREVVIGTPNVFLRDYLANTYQTVVEQIISRTLGYDVTVLFVIGT